MTLSVSWPPLKFFFHTAYFTILSQINKLLKVQISPEMKSSSRVVHFYSRQFICLEIDTTTNSASIL